MLSEAALNPAPRAARRGDCCALMCGEKMPQPRMPTVSGCQRPVCQVDKEGTIYI